MRKILIGGIDEAGRGSALGPLVMAAVLVNKEQEEQLMELGVRDSKELSKKNRERLAKEIKDLAEKYAIVKITPKELNELMPRKSLNEIEAMKAAQLIQEIGEKPAMLIVDSPDIIASNFAKRIKKYLPFNLLIKAEHFADKTHAVVSAASILAKVARDSEVDTLKRYYGEVGSGYWHDPLTQSFIEKWTAKHGKLPSCARAHWQPNIRTLDKKLQKTLEEF